MEVKDYTLKNLRHLLKKIEEDPKMEDILCSCIGRINIVKWSVKLKAIYRLHAFPTKFSMPFLTEKGINNPEICMES